MSRPLGPAVTGFTPPPPPGPEVIAGRFVTLQRLDPARHAAELAAANGDDNAMWDYLGYGPFVSADAYRGWVEAMAGLDDPRFYAFVDAASGRAVAVGAFLEIVPAHGTIEVGHLGFSPLMRRSAAGSEAVMLMVRWAFDAGYRRVEWKCDALNAASRRAALRYGFTFEGLFRQHRVIKGHNRDTAWFSIIDGEWPAIRDRWDAWLDPANFDAAGRQRVSLARA